MHNISNLANVIKALHAHCESQCLQELNSLSETAADVRAVLDELRHAARPPDKQVEDTVEIGVVLPDLQEPAAGVGGVLPMEDHIGEQHFVNERTR